MKWLGRLLEVVGSWFERRWWPLAALSDVQADVAAIRVMVGMIVDANRVIIERLDDMGAREDAAYAKLAEDIQKVKDGWASLVAERDALKQALEEADANKAAAVQAALDADSEVDASKVEAADAALAELVVPPAPEPEPQPEPAPEA